MFVQGNPVPYKPASLDTAKATLTTHASESIEGAIGDPKTIPSTDWAWAKCSAANPFPGTPDPTEICLKNGFDPRLLYQVVFTAKDPYVLGIGFAAFRDVAVFFRNATQDDEGTPNPVAGNVSWVISRGRSQSGNFLRAFIQLGFTQGEDNRRVHDGAWPIIAGRRVTLNARFATPDGALKMYQAGSEGPLWWAAWPDPVRGLPAAGILDRCTATKTCPKIIEHFGSAEVWGLQLEPELRRHVGGQGHPAAGQRSPVLHSQHSAWRRRRWLQRRARRRARMPGHQLRQGDFRRQPGAAHRNLQRAPRAFPQLGDEGDASARERLADAGRRVPRRSNEGGAGISDDSGRAGHGADRLDQPGARLRLGAGLQLRRRIRRAVEECRPS